MKTIKRLLFFALGLNFSIAHAQQFTNYTSAQGLVNNNVLCAAIDAHGNKWFGADYYSAGNTGGVSKFYDTTWTTYTTANGLVGNITHVIVPDAHGNLWFGTGQGVSKYNGTSWTNYTTSDGLGGTTVESMAIDAYGNLWFGAGASAWGVSKFDGTNWTTYSSSNSHLPDNHVRAIAADAQGNQWFGTDAGVAKFDGTNWTVYTTANGLAGDAVDAIAIDSKGNKWFGSGGGLSKFDGTTWTTYFSGTNIFSIAIDSGGNKWCGGDHIIYKLQDLTSTSYTGAPGLSSGFVTSIATDKQNTIWFTVYGGGVIKFGDEKVTAINQEKGTNFNVYPVPATDFISVDGVGAEATVSIYNLSGELVLDKQKAIGKINISNLERGFYIAEIKDGIRILNKKIILE